MTGSCGLSHVPCSQHENPKMVLELVDAIKLADVAYQHLEGGPGATCTRALNRPAPPLSHHKPMPTGQHLLPSGSGWQAASSIRTMRTNEDRATLAVRWITNHESGSRASGDGLVPEPQRLTWNFKARATAHCWTQKLHFKNIIPNNLCSW